MRRAAFDVQVKRIAAENIPRHSLRNFLRARVEIAIVLLDEYARWLSGAGTAIVLYA
jgi:hypothetical protein